MVNYHGTHCRLRSFPTKCPRCKSPVLYWECSHGAKLFFDYPIYGRAFKHRCGKVIEKRTNVKLSRPEQFQQSLKEKKYSCPACGKIFGDEKALLNHIHRLMKTDNTHFDHFGSALDLIDFNSESENIDEIFTQTSSLNLRQNTFDFDEIKQKIDDYAVKQNLDPNNPDFFIFKKKKSKNTKT